jgi:O-antigen chain-terminating methyltransferase
MDEAQEIDVEQIMRRIRENIHRKRGAEAHPTSEKHPSPVDNGQTAADLAYLHSGYNIQHVSFASHRRIVGPLLVALKKVLRKLLTPILERQSAYNAASARVTTHIRDRIETLAHQQALVSEQLETFERRQAEFQDTVSRTQVENFKLREEILAAQSQALHDMHSQLRPALDLLGQHSTVTRERVSRAERKLRRILHALASSQPQDGRPEPKPVEERPALPLLELEPTFDYAGFEERFRGSEEDIKDRQRIYVRYFEGREDVIDIGCGRGEFLELLRESGITARGVDLDLDMVLLCREKGLDVAREDAFSYLEALPDDSAGGIFAAQVIEHLHPRRVIELVKLCYRKLALDGVLILETPNPKCLLVFAETFYKDLSHVQPVHPETMQFLFEATRFHEVELSFSAPVNPSARIPLLQAPGADLEAFNQGIERLNSLLFGFQDYAVIGRKGPGVPTA